MSPRLFPFVPLLLLALVLFGLLPVAAQAELEVVTRHAYFDIDGDDAKQLRRAMRRECTRRNTSDGCWGHTDWKVKWRYDYRRKNGQCAVTHVRVSARITYSLPRWPDAETAPPELRAKWERMLDVLTLHEANHGGHAITAAERIEREFLDLPPAEDCDALKETLDIIGKHHIREAGKMDDAYDERTDGGKTEGLSLR